MGVEEKQLKHLEMIQGAIARMAGNSFLLKGWNITIAVGTIALTAKDSRADLAAIAILPIFVFWSLDAYYLALERGFRALFITSAATPDPLFTMQPDAVTRDVWIECMFRPAVWPVHLSMLLVTLLVTAWGIINRLAT